jgi:hypothetical protein
VIASLVNLDDLVLVGPGSEWFWTAVSGIVLAITFVAIYRQLRAQSAANALQRIETVHSRWGSKELALARLEVALALRDATLDATDDTRVDVILDFFELLENLRAQRALGVEEIARAYGSSIQVWWRLLQPDVEAIRALEGSTVLWSGLERLDGMMAAFARRKGVNRSVLAEIPREALVASVIERSARRLKLIHDAESTVIPEITPPAPEPGAAAAG